MSLPNKRPERRRAVRRPVLSTFSLFVVVPRKGAHRLALHDISERGIGFDLDTEGESPEDFPVASGDRLEVEFYLNPSLHIPLAVKVARVELRGQVRRLGADFEERSGRAYQAFASFLQVLEKIEEVGRISSG